MNYTKKGEEKALDESLRRMGNIMASPWLATAYNPTEPRIERAWLRRAGLSRAEAAQFLEMLCERSLLDRGARAVVEDVCRARGIRPEAAIRLLLAGTGWPEEENEDAKI